MNFEQPLNELESVVLNGHKIAATLLDAVTGSYWLGLSVPGRAQYFLVRIGQMDAERLMSYDLSTAITVRSVLDRHPTILVADSLQSTSARMVERALLDFVPQLSYVRPEVIAQYRIANPTIISR